MTRLIFITGTDTDAGKTVLTAAVAATLNQHQPGQVAVFKPAQTGVDDDEPGDVAEVSWLSGVTSVSEGIRLKLPAAPPQAARAQDAQLPTLDELAQEIRALAASHKVVIVEGSGGVLVQLDMHSHTIADLALKFPQAETLIATRADLGTLNHTELTAEALIRRGINVAGTVITWWPEQPDEVVQANRDHLEKLRIGDTAVPLLGVIPHGAPQLEVGQFQMAAPTWIHGIDRS